jgi:hypothetical protein
MLHGGAVSFLVTSESAFQESLRRSEFITYLNIAVLEVPRAEELKTRKAAGVASTFLRAPRTADPPLPASATCGPLVSKGA